MSHRPQKHELTAIIKNRKGEVISIGKNSYIKTHPIMIKLARGIGIFDSKKVYLHAEVDAIIKLKDLSKAYSIEIYRYHKKSNIYVTSEPCQVCMSAIKHTPIKLVKYVNSEGILTSKVL